ncbi:PIG-L deacetylase family protein [Bradyrhizobium sp. CCBAU 53338]|uniref:PIG-L deacetylase family protein n=1 Tax=Bradyrhizobium sp. CCBAU 53338 TaxID=1325111 RepID=UPI00188D30CF|nr:PIG-L family deacetylase [Bradyrhizobium sp. CCBAU 53338]QOZ52007.1 PIG-L family deacetylase [Bradyrhizobium sp. CCBAU 53338]
MTHRTILVCAAHPDDEILGCGGTMARHVDRGDSVHVVFVADGIESRKAMNAERERLLTERREAAFKAANIIGCERPHFFDYPDQRLDTISLLDITQSIETLLAALQPDLVYTHHGDDLNADHRLVSEATMTAVRPMPGQKVVAVYGFETLSSTEWVFQSRGNAFRPNHFVGVASTLVRKLDALRAYDAEMRDFPHPRSYEAVAALTKLRGATVGLAAAEAFTVLREVEP